MYLSRQHLYPGHSWQQCLCSAASLAQMQKVFFFWLCFLLKPRITFVLHSPNSAGSAAVWTIGDYDEKSGMNSGDEDV